MAPIAVKYIGRAQSRRAVGLLGLLTGALLSLWRLLADANEPDPGLVATNRALEPELAQRLPTLGERIDPLEWLAVLRAQCAEVEQLHAALEALDVVIPSEMPEQVSRLALLAEAVLRSLESRPPVMSARSLPWTQVRMGRSPTRTGRSPGTPSTASGRVPRLFAPTSEE